MTIPVPATYAEATAGLDKDQTRKAALVLRAAGSPITFQGYVARAQAQLLSRWTGPLSEAYDKAERQMGIEERERDNDPMDPFQLPRDSRITTTRVARRAARSVNLEADADAA